MSSNRRNFLKQAAGFASLTLWPTRSLATPAPANLGRVSLGHSLYGMRSVPLPEAVDQCARIGFRNVELALDPGFHCAPAQFSRPAREELRQQLAAVGLEVSGLMRNLQLYGGLTPAENSEAIKEAAGVAHDISSGGPFPPLETTLGGKPGEWETRRNQMAELLAEWAMVAKSCGIGLVVKAHMNNAVDAPDKLVWLLTQVANPAVAATYDYSHYEARGISMESSWAALSAYTKFVHVKDSGTAAGKPVFLLPGEGRVDYPHLFRLMGASGYRGPVVTEVSSMVSRRPGYDPIAVARQCHDFLARALDESGLPHA
ncbi:MAG: sugar phosphate isomerase/epimerase [Lacunisphaera sp.]